MSRNNTLLERQKLIDDLHHLNLLYIAYLNKTIHQAVSSLDITHGQGLLIIFLDNGYDTPGELSDLLGMKPSGVSMLIKTLHEKGLVSRFVNKTDQRSISVVLTDEGSNTCRRLEQAWREYYPINLSSFSATKLESMMLPARLAVTQIIT